MENTKWDLYEDLYYSDPYFEGEAFEDIDQDDTIVDELDLSEMVSEFEGMHDPGDFGHTF